MGLGTGHTKQFAFEKVSAKFRDSHGGILRNQRRGRKAVLREDRSVSDLC